jgi:hypothetical protein
METDTLRVLSCFHGKKKNTHAPAKQSKTKVPTTLLSKPTCYFLQEHHTKILKDIKEKFKRTTTTKQCNYETMDQKASKKNMELDLQSEKQD